MTRLQLIPSGRRETTGPLEPMLDRLPVAAYFCDADGLITYYNQRAAELWGREPMLLDPADRWCGSSKLLLGDGTPIRHEECWMARAIQENRSFTGEEIIVERPDRTRVHALAHASPLHDARGRVTGAINVLVDVSDRREAELARARLAAIVEHSHDAIISKSLDGVITSWNRAAERMYGYSKAEAIGQPILFLIPHERQSEEAMILDRIRRGELIESYETERLRKDGRRIEVSLTISPIRDESGRVIGASKIARDIGARKAEERRRIEIEDALRLADRRKDEFLAMMAHELRNPLAPMINSLEALQLGSPDAAMQHDLLDIVRRQAGTMVRLVDDLMDASRMGRGMIDLKRELVPLGAVVQSAIETARPLIDARQHRLGLQLPATALIVHGDRTRLVQIVTNLLNNAAKYTPREGRIEVSVERDDGYVVLRVADNGMGVPQHMLGRIFEMFTQVDNSMERSHGGLGIGLSIVKRLAELHGGSVEALSDGPGHGTDVVVRLPLAPSAADSAGVMAPAVVPAPRRVLIADDNTDAATSLAVLLRALGQDVTVVHDGNAALERAGALRPEVLLLDIGMPGLNGYAVAQRIRSEPWGRKPLLVALTGWGQPEDRRKSKEAGFDEHLVKPVTIDALCRVLVQAPAASS